MGGADDQAKLFMLAEATLRRFAERIADDLPEDLAVLSQVPLPAAASDSVSSGNGADNDADGSNEGESEQNLEAASPSTYSLGEFTAEPSYHVSFSQHYRQLLLICL